MANARAIPVLINVGNEPVELERIRLGRGTHDEDWLQALIHNHPAILPISNIEPSFGDAIPAGREVQCRSGYIDNLYLTPLGDIVLVETKLWRNGQMRREVVAQALDYVAALTSMSYEAFEHAVALAEQAPARLYDLVRDHPEALDEGDFIDAVSNNLRRGRMLVLVLGDGIRTETEALGELLQSHAGAHFTFALVELATWRSPAGDILAVPGILAKTVMIERGIVRVEDGVAVVHPIPAASPKGPQTITSTDFWEAMAQRDPSLPATIESFLAELEPMRVYPDFKASLNLKVDLADRERPINLGYIERTGKVWFHPTAWNLPASIWRPYFDVLAGLVGGVVIDEPSTKFVAVNGRSGPTIEQLLPRHQDAWIKAIEKLIRSVSEEEA